MDEEKSVCTEQLMQARVLRLPAPQRPANTSIGIAAGWSWRAVGAISFILIVARWPDALLSPQFYAEDGKYFYAQAYNLGGLHALTIPLADIS